MKACITSWSSRGRENYNKAMLNLIRSTRQVGWNGGYVMGSLDGDADEYMDVPIKLGAYPRSEKYQFPYNHEEVPYGFKPEQIQVAREQGYDIVIWCDSTIRLLRDPAPLIQVARERAVVAFDNLGHPLANYISDVGMQRLELTPEELQKAKNIMACCLIFDFTRQLAVDVFEHWIQLRADSFSFHNGYGSTRPEFIAHKHDQSALAGVLYKHGVEVLPYGALAYPPYHETKAYGEVTFLNKGVI